MIRSMVSAVTATVMITAAAGQVLAQDAAAGVKVYADQKCSICHSVAGKGNQKGSLDGVASKLTADDMRAWIVDAKGMTAKTKAARKPEMRSYSLPKADLDALVAYLQTLKK